MKSSIILTFSAFVASTFATLYVGNLSYDATEEDLQSIFSEYGNVDAIKIAVDRETGRSRGFAYVKLDSDDGEDAAIEALDGVEFLGRDLRVSKAKR
ncbi:hypothetical protein LLEC1_05788 [Akanthomyces lecanii]|uniref:RRM domain-containing protein n=1 Tax=Cordyceps confragosa TaxID=2714763 RepID=A0A179I1D3_CORDF|nr:hypothetical protein LLEC1_05788 [Akanthomyces lecanii]